MQGMRAPQLADAKEELASTDVDLNQVLGLDDLIKADDAFFAATGITGGTFLEGVHFDREKGVTTHSIVIRAITGSVRYIKGIHQLNRPMDFKNREIIGTHGLEDL
jgi:fructose-1,6-bisphosphatase II